MIHFTIFLVNASSIGCSNDICLVTMTSSLSKFVTASQDGSITAAQEYTASGVMWEIILSGVKNIYLKNFEFKKYLSLDDGSSIVKTDIKGNVTSTLKIESVDKSQTFALKASNGKYLSIQDDGGVKADSDSIGKEENFIIVPLSK